MQHHVGAALGLLGAFEGEGRAAVANPVGGFGAFLVALREDFHVLGHHEGGVETQAELPDNLVFGGRVLLLVLLHKLGGTGEGNLVDVLLDFLTGHAQAVVGNRDFAGFFVYGHAHFQLAQLAFELAQLGQALELLGGIDGIADQFPQENLVVGIQELLDNREDVLGVDGDGAGFLHGIGYQIN